jgi:hypothetical protein
MNILPYVTRKYRLKFLYPILLGRRYVLVIIDAVVLEHSNMAQLASNLYLSVHTAWALGHWCCSGLTAARARRSKPPRWLPKSSPVYGLLDQARCPTR